MVVPVQEGKRRSLSEKILFSAKGDRRRERAAVHQTICDQEQGGKVGDRDESARDGAHGEQARGGERAKAAGGRRPQTGGRHCEVRMIMSMTQNARHFFTLRSIHGL